MTVLIFLAVLFLLILVHEWGHFIVAKKTGMQVDEFGIGFPPKLFGIKKGETEYTFNLFPIGGFVKILGEDGTNIPSPRSFTAKSRLAQAAVLVAGVAMNILFAWFLFVLVFMIGVPATVTEEDATEAAELTITEVLPESPASEVGLRPGMTIVGLSSDGDVLVELTPSTFSDFTTEHSSGQLTLSVFDEEESTVEVTPINGLIDNDLERPAIGVALALVETKERTLVEALKDGTVATYSTLAAIIVGVTNLLADAFTLTADLSQVAGPVGIVDLVGDAAAFGLTSLMTFTAIISLNLAVINLLPIPALDGGRLLFVAVEAFWRRPINPIWMARVNFVGFSLLILLMILITINDVFYK